MDKEMKRTALITGGCRGIGFAVSRKLGQEGMNLVILSTGGEEKYRNALKSLTEDGTEYLYVQGSVDRAEDRERLLREALARFGRVDVLINNAGVAPRVRADLLEMTEESFDRVIGINTKGTLFLSQLIARQMIRQDQIFRHKGVIINIGSCSAEVSSISRGEYCISKAGVAMITKLFADRLAKEDILVHEVRPGVIATDMTEKVKDKYDALISEGVFPIRRWGKAEDVAEIVALFCSEKIGYTTGNYIDVDGGFHIRRL